MAIVIVNGGGGTKEFPGDGSPKAELLFTTPSANALYIIDISWIQASTNVSYRTGWDEIIVSGTTVLSPGKGSKILKVGPSSPIYIPFDNEAHVTVQIAVTWAWYSITF